MGKLKGFIEYERTDEGLIPVKKRVKNYKEFTLKPSDEKLKEQGGRCMDCGVPFCHSGCPLGITSLWPGLAVIGAFKSSAKLITVSAPSDP